jgi:ABC-2 type transport system permease protein
MTDVADISIRANRQVPKDLEQVVTVARYDVLKHLRSKRIYGIIAILILIIIVNMILPPALGNDYSKNSIDFASGFISLVPTVILVIAVLFAGDAIVSEFQGRTGYLLFPNPVKRWVLYTGKYVAALGLAIFLLLLYYGIVVILTLVMTGGASWLILYSLLLAMIYASATIGVGFMISSFMKGSTGSLILTLALLLLILPMVSGIMSMTSFKPDFLVSFAGDSISYVLNDPYPTDSKEIMDIGGGQTMTIWLYYPQVLTAVVVMLAYAIVTFLVGYLAFKKREMVS